MRMTFPGFDRITVDPDALDGRPCIRGLRLTVQRVLAILAHQPSGVDLHADYPELEPEDLQQVLAYAASRMEERVPTT